MNQPKQSLVLWIIPVVIIIAIVAYFGLQNYQLNQQSNSQKATPSPVVATTSPNSNSSTNAPSESIPTWNEYKAEDLELTVQYPSIIKTIKRSGSRPEDPAISFVIKSEYNPAQEANIDTAPFAIYVGNRNSTRQDFYFGGYKWTENLIATLRTLSIGQTQKGTKESITKLESPKIDGINGYKYSASPNIQGNQYFGFAFVKGESTYLFTFDETDSDLTMSDFDKMLASIKL